MVKRIREQKGKITTEYAYNITSLNKQKASAKRLLELNRSHWEIEKRLHWVRDVTFDEDRSQIRKKNGAKVMASLREQTKTPFYHISQRMCKPILRGYLGLHVAKFRRLWNVDEQFLLTATVQNIKRWRNYFIEVTKRP